MKFKKILVTGFSRENLDEKTWVRIGKLANKIVFEPEDNIDCLFARFNKVDKQLINQLPQLKYIGLLGTGTGTVNLNYCKQKGAVVCNIPGYATEAVAEWVFGLILEQLRSLERAKQTAQAKDFSGDGFFGHEIKNKKFGIIGLGKIGLRVAEIAQGFGANVSYWSRTSKENAEKIGIHYKKLDNLITTSDFLSLHTLTTEETKEILNAKRINSLKSGTIVINVSGMEQVNIPALIKRLAKGDITFIFDHPDEMEKSDIKKLSKFSNCIIYPPIGFTSQEAHANKQAIFVSNLENYLTDQPSNVVN